MVDPNDVIYCEVCRLPHRRGAGGCEECGHALGNPAPPAADTLIPMSSAAAETDPTPTPALAAG